MSTNNKHFKVKHGLIVTEGGTFGGPIIIDPPVEADHATTKQYLEDYVDSVLSNYGLTDIDGGSPTTTVWGSVADGGSV